MKLTRKRDLRGNYLKVLNIDLDAQIMISKHQQQQNHLKYQKNSSEFCKIFRKGDQAIQYCVQYLDDFPLATTPSGIEQRRMATMLMHEMVIKPIYISRANTNRTIRELKIRENRNVRGKYYCNINLQPSKAGILSIIPNENNAKTITKPKYPEEILNAILKYIHDFIVQFLMEITSKIWKNFAIILLQNIHLSFDAEDFISLQESALESLLKRDDL
ncbi:hypothetical protein Glove_196g56 [Diversispora epigaea]|uniref:Uncharacterized protein n=1 Tax=Diversispora epigaea TaxID=1348612 RepID=A0A397IKX5_9GLOM|nr:hypothetical protein Glove_196g56 [Diversispora epigaea]